MASQELSVKVSVSDLEEWRTLIDCLSKHFDSLPAEVQQAIKKVVGE